MRRRAADLIAELREPPPSLDRDECEEAAALLAWMDDGHFTFLGFREYELATHERRRSPAPGRGLGARDPARAPGASARAGRRCRRARARSRASRIRSCSRRPTAGRPSTGPPTSTTSASSASGRTGRSSASGASSASTRRRRTARVAGEIPVVRRKVEAVVARAGFPPASHAEKALVEILDTYPRDELFQIPEDELFELAMGILALGERQRVRLFTRRDALRAVRVLPGVPPARPLPHPQPRAHPGDPGRGVRCRERRLRAAPVGVGARAHPLHGAAPAGRAARLRRRPRSRRGSWRPPARGPTSCARRCSRRPARSRAPRCTAATATRSRSATATTGSPARRWRTSGGSSGWPTASSSRSACTTRSRRPRARCAASSTAAASRRRSPRSCRCSRAWACGCATSGPTRSRRGTARRRGSTTSASSTPPTASSTSTRCSERFQDAFIARLARRGRERRLQRPRAARRAWTGATSPSCGRSRATCGRRAIAFSERYMEQALLAHPRVAAALVELFRARFDPARDRAPEAADAIAREIEEAIDAVESLDEDRILRSFLAVVRAMLRTNHFQPDADGPKPYLSFKLDPARIPLLPAPRPRFEIFVHSPRVEGVHLRGGAVARGGLRWSDRREDFRTEILGLMKAQMVKNALIVPVGAKGGFVVKRPPAGRERLADEVVACYRTFISGLLDLTDTRPRGTGDAAARRRPPRRRRPVPRRRRRQGHGDVLGHRERDRAGVRLLARRRVRLGRLGRLRPQGDGDHGAQRLGVGQAPLPRAGHRHPVQRLHRRGDRRHVRRRVRQRHAAVAAHQARRRLRPPPRVPRPGPRSGGRLRRAPAAVRAAALLVGRTTTAR